MVQNIPASSLHGYQNNIGNVKSNKDVVFTSLPQGLEQDTFTPQFTGKKQEKKGVLGKVLLLAAAVGGAVLLKKNWTKVTQYVDDIIKKFRKKPKQATAGFQRKIEKNAEKVQTTKKAARKHKLEHTVPNKNPKPITNAREAEVIENINLSHVNANTQKMVEKTGAGTVTTAQQAAYDKAIAYQAPTATQKVAIAELHSKNAAERAVKNSIGNRNCTGAGNLRLAEAAAQAEAKAAKTVANGAYRHPGTGNIYHVQNGTVTRVELYQRNKAGEFVKNSVELTDPTKISKHMAKQDVSLTDAYFKEIIS